MALENILGRMKRLGKSIRYASTAALIATAAIGCQYEQPLPAIPTQTETTGSGMTAVVFMNNEEFGARSPSIDIDRKNNPHVSYKGSDGQVHYAMMEEGTWKGRSLKSDAVLSYGNGNYSKTIIDDTGKAHVCFSTSDGNAEDLAYATNKSGAWKVEVVDNGASVGLENDMVVDREGIVHISQWEWSKDKVGYTTNKTGEWTTTLLPNYAKWNDTEIELDSAGNVFIGYTNRSTNNVNLTMNPLEEMAEEEIDTGSLESMVIDSNNTLYMLTRSSNGLDLLTKIEGTWYEETVAELTAKEGDTENKSAGYISSSSLTIDNNNKAHVAFTIKDYVANTGELHYATDISGTWKTSLLDSNIECSNPSICIDSSNKVHLVYAQGTDYKDTKITYLSFFPSDME